MSTPPMPPAEPESKKRKALVPEEKQPKVAKRSKDASPGVEHRAQMRSPLPQTLPRSVLQYVGERAEALVELLESDDQQDALAARRAAYELFSRDVVTLGLSRRKRAKPSKITQTDTAAGLKKFRDDHAFTVVPRAGAWHQTLVGSGQALKVARRDLQLLNHVSQALLTYVADRGAETMEIEAMAVNGRILVSANDQNAFRELSLIKNLPSVLAHIPAGGDPQIRGKASKLADLMEALATNVRPAGFDDARAARGVQRLVQLSTDCQMVDEQYEPVRTILATLHRSATEAAARSVIDIPIPVGVLESGMPPEEQRQTFAYYLTDPAYEGRVLVVPPSDGFHAEQNLVLTLVMSGVMSIASVAGGKRPCTVCWLTLSLARSCGIELCFGNRPGGFWNTTTEKGLQRVAEQLGIPDAATLQKRLVEIADGTLDIPRLRQHITRLGAAADATTPAVLPLRDEDVDRHAIYEKEYSTAQLTQSYGDDQDNDPNPPPRFPTDAEADKDTDTSVPTDVQKAELLRLASDLDEDDLDDGEGEPALETKPADDGKPLATDGDLEDEDELLLSDDSED